MLDEVKYSKVWNESHANSILNNMRAMHLYWNMNQAYFIYFIYTYLDSNLCSAELNIYRRFHFCCQGLISDRLNATRWVVRDSPDFVCKLTFYFYLKRDGVFAWVGGQPHQTLYANLIENLCYFNLTLGSNVTVCLRGWALARHTRLKVWRQFNLSTARLANLVNKYLDAKLINCWKERCHHKVESICALASVCLETVTSSCFPKEMILEKWLLQRPRCRTLGHMHR